MPTQAFEEVKYQLASALESLRDDPAAQKNAERMPISFLNSKGISIQRSQADPAYQASALRDEFISIFSEEEFKDKRVDIAESDSFACNLCKLSVLVGFSAILYAVAVPGIAGLSAAYEAGTIAAQVHSFATFITTNLGKLGTINTILQSAFDLPSITKAIHYVLQEICKFLQIC